MYKRDELFSSGSSSYYSSCSQSSLNASLNDDIENSPTSEDNCSNSGGSEFDMLHNGGNSPKNAYIELPKKRWLREAVQDQSLWDATNDLARPINWSEDIMYNDDIERTTNNNDFINNIENQNRPSVLVCVQGGKSKEISSDEIQGAMALVELKNASQSNKHYRI